MEEILKFITENKLSPNQMFLLFSMRESVSMPFITTNYELSELVNKGWVVNKNELTPKALELVNQLDGFIKKAKKKTDKVTMGDDFESNISKYNQMYPKMKLKTGKYARSAEKNLVDGFRWFFDNYDYTWEEVLKAVAKYLDDREQHNWDYTTNSQYFIRKQNIDKSWKSDLADWCQAVRDGSDDIIENHFKDNVFNARS